LLIKSELALCICLSHFRKNLFKWRKRFFSQCS